MSLIKKSFRIDKIKKGQLYRVKTYDDRNFVGYIVNINKNELFLIIDFFFKQGCTELIVIYPYDVKELTYLGCVEKLVNFDRLNTDDFNNLDENVDFGLVHRLNILFNKTMD